MLIEAIAAGLLGIAVLVLVLEPLLRGNAPSQASAPAPDLEEPEVTRKGVALAGLREIEFDRATGKLSDQDYQALHAKYTAEALAAMREEERKAGPPDEIEAMVSARLRAIRSAPAPTSPGASLLHCPACGPRSEPDAVFCSSCGRRLPLPGCCASCGAAVRADGRFCEACGSRVAA